MFHRFFYESLPETSLGSRIRLARSEEAHLFKILRATPGDELELFDGKGREARAKITSDKFLEIAELSERPAPERRIHLYLAPPRKQKMDLLLKQCAELGVWRIVPLIAERSVSLPDENAVRTRWRDHLIEGCKQSRNPYLPETVAPLKVAAAVADARTRGASAWLGSPYESTPFAQTGPPEKEMAFFVGPEGGFSPAELNMLAEICKPLRIGGYILRVETAAVAGLAVLLTR